ncbi:MAG TPA: histidine--tRNA ligase [Miltoncostaeaceae bacterium]|nr:histidine--tRNA ligase [Miltoncostaeaceae bacterium]
MTTRPEAPRGTRDVLPDEWRLREAILRAATAAFDAHGYGRISTPTFEHTEVFVRGVGESTDIVRKEMYTFTDLGGRSLTLRPEGTAPVVRAFVEHGMHKLPLPVKLWYTAPMFRYEAPQSGRQREHTQIGAEALGSDDPLLDAEVVALLHGLYATLGVPGVRLRISSLGDAEGRPAYRAALLAHLERHRGDLPEEARARMADNPMRLFDAKDAAVRAVMAEAPRILDHLTPAAQEHHAAVRAALSSAGVPWEEDPSLVRGLDYYTRTVFEFTCDRLGAQSGIGGGGRYDGLVASLGGPPTPGIGFGTGIERIVIALQEAGRAPAAPGLDVYFAAIGTDARVEVFPVMTRLRAHGVQCDADHQGRSMKGMMRHASSLGARTVVILGERERAEGLATLRDMATGEQRRVPLASLEESLRATAVPA